MATDDGASALLLAVERDDVEGVRYCIETSEVDIHTRGNRGCQPIHYAALSGSLTVLRYLISKGADVAATFDGGISALHLAATGSDLETVECCVEEAGMDIHHRDNEGWQAIHYAAQDGRLDILRYLICKGVKETATSNDGVSVLHCAALSGNMRTVLYCLNDLDIDIHSKDNKGIEPIHYAARPGGTTVLRYLYGKGGAVAPSTNNGESVLHFAAESDDVDTVQFCVEEAEMNINSRDNKGLQPIHYAARSRHPILRYLISKGADVAAVTDEGYSVLHVAALNGDVDKLKYCVEETKLPCDVKTDHGETVLHAATLLEGTPNLDVVKYCVEVLKIPVDARDNDENTAKDYIKDKPEHKDIYDYLDTRK